MQSIKASLGDRTVNWVLDIQEWYHIRVDMKHGLPASNSNVLHDGKQNEHIYAFALSHSRKHSYIASLQPTHSPIHFELWLCSKVFHFCLLSSTARSIGRASVKTAHQLLNRGIATTSKNPT